MKMYHLAIDIGASSGRHILACVENGKILTEEVYRFENGYTIENGALVWDIESLFENVKNGIKKCGDLGKIPATIAIDTWGVDYVLLDENRKEIAPCMCYRDSSTQSCVSAVKELCPDLYEKTGIQTQSFNTIYQLYRDRLSGKLEGARHFLMMPEYLSFKLTGEIKNEYTNATTTNLVNAKSNTWDGEVLERLGIDKAIFKPLSNPTELVGRFTKEVEAEMGFDADVIFCPSHDTASAVLACPVAEGGVYISSGTWSLMGCELKEACTVKKAEEANFTNEGGIEYRYRFLKNIMGMWLFQGLRKSLDKKYTYDEMMEMAKKSTYTKTFDPNDARLTAPKDMLLAIRACLGEDADIKDVLRATYHSLAKAYKKTVEEIEGITGISTTNIAVVGGGSRDRYLNELIKEYTGKKVYAGPVEATAIGNILSQLMYSDKNMTVEKARELVKISFSIQEV
ncbi:MAG: rhamnulokinase [Clostridia bacterium]|nr:rhamnulokinase [Clostridia bacterium]